MNNFVPGDGVIYIDPPYDNTTMYGHSLDVNRYVGIIKRKCYISEGYPLTENSFLISKERDKGGISGKRTQKNQEWLSIVDGAKDGKENNSNDAG